MDTDVVCMIEAHEENLEEVYALALAERARGAQYINVVLRPRTHIAKYLLLWEGCPGEVIGRTFWEERTAFNPDLPAPRTVQFLKLRLRIADVAAAWQRAKRNLDRDLAKPLQANRIPGVENITTSR